VQEDVIEMAACFKAGLFTAAGTMGARLYEGQLRNYVTVMAYLPPGLNLSLYQSVHLFAANVKVPELVKKVRSCRKIRNMIMHAESRLDKHGAEEMVKLATVLVVGIFNHRRMA
jgi:hypothetical protein